MPVPEQYPCNLPLPTFYNSQFGAAAEVEPDTRHFFFISIASTVGIRQRRSRKSRSGTELNVAQSTSQGGGALCSPLSATPIFCRRRYTESHRNRPSSGCSSWRVRIPRNWAVDADDSRRSSSSANTLRVWTGPAPAEKLAQVQRSALGARQDRRCDLYCQVPLRYSQPHHAVFLSPVWLGSHCHSARH